MFCGPPAALIGEFDVEKGPTILYASEFYSEHMTDADSCRLQRQLLMPGRDAVGNSSCSAEGIAGGATRTSEPEVDAVFSYVCGCTLLGKDVATGCIQPDCEPLFSRLVARAMSGTTTTTSSASLGPRASGDASHFFHEKESQPAAGSLTFCLPDVGARGQQRRCAVVFIHEAASTALLPAWPLLLHLTTHLVNVWRQRCLARQHSEAHVLSHSGGAAVLGMRPLGSLLASPSSAFWGDGSYSKAAAVKAAEREGLMELHSFFGALLPLIFYNTSASSRWMHMIGLGREEAFLPLRREERGKKNAKKVDEAGRNPDSREWAGGGRSEDNEAPRTDLSDDMCVASPSTAPWSSFCHTLQHRMEAVRTYGTVSILVREVAGAALASSPPYSPILCSAARDTKHRVTGRSPPPPPPQSPTAEMREKSRQPFMAEWLAAFIQRGRGVGMGSEGVYNAALLEAMILQEKSDEQQQAPVAAGRASASSAYGPPVLGYRSRRSKVLMLLTALFRGTQIVVSGTRSEDTAMLAISLTRMLPHGMVHYWGIRPGRSGEEEEPCLKERDSLDERKDAGRRETASSGSDDGRYVCLCGAAEYVPPSVARILTFNDAFLEEHRAISSVLEQRSTADGLVHVLVEDGALIDVVLLRRSPVSSPHPGGRMHNLSNRKAHESSSNTAADDANHPEKAVATAVAGDKGLTGSRSEHPPSQPTTAPKGEGKSTSGSSRGRGRGRGRGRKALPAVLPVTPARPSTLAQRLTTLVEEGAGVWTKLQRAAAAAATNAAAAAAAVPPDSPLGDRREINAADGVTPVLPEDAGGGVEAEVKEKDGKAEAREVVSNADAALETETAAQRQKRAAAAAAIAADTAQHRCQVYVETLHRKMAETVMAYRLRSSQTLKSMEEEEAEALGCPWRVAATRLRHNRRCVLGGIWELVGPVSDERDRDTIGYLSGELPMDPVKYLNRRSSLLFALLFHSHSSLLKTFATYAGTQKAYRKSSRPIFFCVWITVDMSQGTEVPKALDANICKARRLERVKQWEMAALVMFDKILSQAAPPAAVVDPTAEVTISQENGRPVTFSIPVMPEKAPIHVKLSISSFKDLRLKAENGHINISYDVSGQEENTAAVASSNIAGNAAAASKAGSNQKSSQCQQAGTAEQIPAPASQRRSRGTTAFRGFEARDSFTSAGGGQSCGQSNARRWFEKRGRPLYSAASPAPTPASNPPFVHAIRWPHGDKPGALWLRSSSSSHDGQRCHLPVPTGLFPEPTTLLNPATDFVTIYIYLLYLFIFVYIHTYMHACASSLFPSSLAIPPPVAVTHTDVLVQMTDCWQWKPIDIGFALFWWKKEHRMKRARDDDHFLFFVFVFSMPTHWYYGSASLYLAALYFFTLFFCLLPFVVLNPMKQYGVLKNGKTENACVNPQ
eukprot:gene455-238_t